MSRKLKHALTGRNKGNSKLSCDLGKNEQGVERQCQSVSIRVGLKVHDVKDGGGRVNPDFDLVEHRGRGPCRHSLVLGRFAFGFDTRCFGDF